jgi:uncharacterized membrane protein YbaN (DUF454 family)
MSKNLNVSNSPIKRALWLTTGIVSLALAYIGFVTPGIPFSIFLVFAAYCFSKSSERMHAWLYNHKHFGPFLTNWVEKRIFPQRMKYAMLLVMSSSVAFLWFTTGNIKAVAWSGGFMALVALWAWRYPGSEEEWQKRKQLND